MPRIIKDIHITITDEDLEKARPLFEDKFEIDPQGCWLWRGSSNPNGRGNCSIKGLRLNAAHVAWMIYRGEEVPKGKELLHTCDVSLCVNPDHLYVGTQADNIRDIWARGRGNPPRGERAGRAKLTEEKVLAIRAEYNSAKRIPIVGLAKKHGMSRSQIWHIVSRKQWTHI